MSTKEDYTSEEWSTLQQALLETGALMVFLEPGREFRESLEIFETLDEAMEKYRDNPVIVSIADMFTAVQEEIEAEQDDEQAELDNDADSVESESQIEESAAGPSYEDNKSMTFSLLKEAIRILSLKGNPREVQDYRHLVIDVAEEVAKVSKTGSFLGFGGQRIDDDEARLIGEIKNVIGLIE